MAQTGGTEAEGKGLGALVTTLNIIVLLVVFGLSRAYPLPACILAAIYFSIVLGIEISKYNTAKEAGMDTSSLKRSIGGNVAWVVAIAAVVLFQVWSVGGFQPTNLRSSYETPAELAERAVQEVKDTTTLPYDADDITRVMDVTSSGSNVQYHYVIHDADTSGVTNDGMKESVRPGVCANTSIGVLLDRGVGLQYSYTVQETGEKFFFQITSADC